MRNTSTDLRTLTQLALLAAVELAMRAAGLGAVPVGPLNMSFLTLPVAVGAMVIGPLAGLVLGGVFGVLSLMDAVSGRSAMTGAFFAVSPVNTVILCVGTRMLMGLCCGWLFAAARRVDRKGTWSYLAGALSAPLLNTLFFMGYICMAFYHLDYVRDLAAAKGAANPVVFVLLLVGVQGLVEAAACGVLGSIVGKAADAFVRRRK